MEDINRLTIFVATVNIHVQLIYIAEKRFTINVVEISWNDSPNSSESIENFWDHSWLKRIKSKWTDCVGDTTKESSIRIHG